ncbi:MAG: shikimate kinase [Lawsonibacter sp.]|nr:shikimate kinase [Lawsonibacter sp.]
MDNIILTGMPGSGKSTIGVLLAKALGLGFVDVDLVIQEREGALLQKILDRSGTAAFLEIEEQAVLNLDCRHTVIAPGGSAMCREGAAQHLSRLGPVVYLNVPLEELMRRIQNMSQRGIAMEPGQTLADVLAYRDPLYRKYADLIVDCPPGQPLDQTVQLVQTAIKECGLLR